MANIVITSTTTVLSIVFNDLSTQVDIVKGTWFKTQLISIELHIGYVYIDRKRGQAWNVTFDGVGGLQIDSINGVAPTSNSDLYDKLIALI